MKRLILLLVSASLFLTACGSKEAEPDYTTKEFEEALNNGEDLTGKTVLITVDALEPSSAFGYNIQTGEHLNFVSPGNPNVKEGDELLVKVEEVASIMGSFIINYKKQ